MRRIVHDLSGRAALWIFIVWLTAAQSVSAQSVSPEKPGQTDCSADEVKGFEWLPGPAPEMRTNFLLKPKPDAESTEIKTHVIYSRILETYAIMQLYSSSRQCFLYAAVDTASLDIKFNLSFVGGSESSRECLLHHCARALSELLQSAAIDGPTFATIIDAIVKDFHRNESADLRFPSLAAELAASEAFRHFYSPGSKERAILDTTAEDYANTGFDQFSAWFASQQSALRGSFGTAPPDQPLPGPSVPSENDDCALGASISVGELTIDHHGWGYRTILLIENGYKTAGLAGIESSKLRALCAEDRSDSASFGEFPWSEMIGRIQCVFQQENRDRWLILYSRQDRQAAAEMRRYARGVASALQADMCVRRGTRLLVVNFVGQR
jgi:hypothetical protein